jgi:hypothetical protein
MSHYVECQKEDRTMWEGFKEFLGCLMWSTLIVSAVTCVILSFIYYMVFNQI